MYRAYSKCDSSTIGRLRVALSASDDGGLLRAASRQVLWCPRLLSVHCKIRRWSSSSEQPVDPLPSTSSNELDDDMPVSDRRPLTIFGSKFPADLEYKQICYNINTVKTAMEMGRTVILLNLDELYESLYDALNQYYSFLGGERYRGHRTRHTSCEMQSAPQVRTHRHRAQRGGLRAIPDSSHQPTREALLLRRESSLA